MHRAEGTTGKKVLPSILEEILYTVVSSNLQICSVPVWKIICKCCISIHVKECSAII